jgi:hypothetical protein
MGSRSRWKQDRNQDGLSRNLRQKVRAMGLSSHRNLCMKITPCRLRKAFKYRTGMNFVIGTCPNTILRLY